MSPNPISHRELPRTSPLLSALAAFLKKTAPRDRLLVAFSGGPDSTALLWGLAQLVRDYEVELHAAHLDHRLDSDSTRRARDAHSLAAAIGVPVTVRALRYDPDDLGGQSIEAFARRHRYAFLHDLAESIEARWILTAHHADDQAETVLLRLLFGSGVEGLGAMRRTRRRLARPLLGLRRKALLETLEDLGLRPVRDPTNQDQRITRNALRARLLPRLESLDPEVTTRLCRLASAARAASRQIERTLTPRLRPRLIRSPLTGERRGAAMERRAFQDLPQPLLMPALALLNRYADAGYPASAAACHELVRQINRGGKIGCDCGAGWRWEADIDTLSVVRSESYPGNFTYTLDAPGSVDVRELGLRVQMSRGRVVPWMFRGAPHRAGLAGVDLGKRRMLVRNRRAGDRIQPLGSNNRRRLKDLLIDRRVPKRERDRLPLLVIDDEIAWVPGITISERYRLKSETEAWIAEIRATEPGFESYELEKFL